MRRLTLRWALIMSAIMAMLSMSLRSCHSATVPSTAVHPQQSFSMPVYRGKTRHLVSPSEAASSNPQPLPPRTTILSSKLNWGALNPQPLPPQVGTMVSH